MARLEVLFDDYSAFHKTRGNKILHRLGIPLIVLSLLGLLARLLIFRSGPIRIDAAVLLIVASTVYYLFLEWRLALAMLAVLALLYAVSLTIPVSILWIIFVVGWILQFVGHAVYEKRQPAFAKNLIHLLVGPLWIVSDAFPALTIPGERAQQSHERLDDDG